MFAVSAYAPTNCSYATKEDEFYDKLALLVLRCKGSDIVLVTDVFDAQFWKFEASKTCLDGRCTLLAQYRGKSVSILSFGNNRLFLSRITSL